MIALQQESSRVTKHLLVLEKSKSLLRSAPDGAEILEIGFDITFDTAALETFDVKGCRALHYDLLVLCAAVEFADRRWKRPATWSRNLHVMLPVVDILTWERCEVRESLQSVLYRLTGDNWSFAFRKAEYISPIGARQGEIFFPSSKTFAMAYSDGLDSRATAALSGKADEGLLIRVASFNNRRKIGEGAFFQIPFKVDGAKNSESSFRSRGFKFAAISAIAASLARITKIVVAESGQGALGPVLLPLHNTYADYRNHPAFFRKMERFINAALGTALWFEQPRLWVTKGQTLEDYLKLPGASKQDLLESRSCWQNRRVVNVGGEKKQCGLCAACLLRRLSVHSADLSEPADTYVVESLGAADVNDALSGVLLDADKKMMVDYGSVGTRHLHQLANLADQPESELRADISEISAATGDPYEQVSQNLRTLLASHAAEWKSFMSAQGEQSFLKSWLDGGRHG